MQWFKSAMIVTSVGLVAALAANGCSSTPKSTTDGGNPDVTTPPNDSGTKKDIGTTDTGGTCTGVVACENCDTSGYSPPEQGSPIQMLNACSSTQLAGYVAACFPPGTQTTCTAFLATDAGACTTCLSATLETDSTWGAISCSDSTHCGLNQSGCVDLILNTVSQEKVKGGAGSCGDLIASDFGCQDYACNACTVTADFTACVQNTETNECKTYADPESSTTGACGILQGDAAPANIDDCFPQTDPDIANTLNVYCGTGT